jgi:hypothetical protein
VVLFYFNEKLGFCILLCVVPCLSRSETFLFAGLSCCSVLAPANFHLHPSFRSAFSFCATARVPVRCQSRAARSPSSAVAIFPCARRSPSPAQGSPAPQILAANSSSVSCAPDSFSFACGLRSGLLLVLCITRTVFWPTCALLVLGLRCCCTQVFFLLPVFLVVGIVFLCKLAERVAISCYLALIYARDFICLAWFSAVPRDTCCIVGFCFPARIRLLPDFIIGLKLFHPLIDFCSHLVRTSSVLRLHHPSPKATFYSDFLLVSPCIGLGFSVRSVSRHDGLISFVKH